MMFWKLAVFHSSDEQWPSLLVHHGSQFERSST